MTRTDYFVTGTDTEIGKTLAACALMHALRQQGKTVAGMKPVAAGIAENGQNDDVRQLLAASNVQPTLRSDDICPYLFKDPIAPHLAAQKEGVLIELERIKTCYQSLQNLADCVVVEGAGGLRVPLDNGPSKKDTADLIQRLGCPVILVVGMKLGCINHALLTIEALLARGIVVAGWISNQIDPQMRMADENLQTLITYLSEDYQIQHLGHIPHLSQGEDAYQASSYLTLPAHIGA